MRLLPLAVQSLLPCVHVSCTTCCPTTVPLCAYFLSVPLAVQLLSSCMQPHRNASCSSAAWYSPCCVTRHMLHVAPYWCMLYTRLPAVLRSRPLLCLCSQLLSVQASLSYQRLRPGLRQPHAITHQLSCDSLSLTHSCMCCAVCSQRLKPCSVAQRREVRVAGWGV